MTGQIEISARVGTNSLVAAGPGRGCAGRRDLGRSCHRDELCERQRKKRTQTPKEDEFRAGSMNVGTRGRSAELVETVTRRRLDCGSLQKNKWMGLLCPSQSRSKVRWLKGKDSVYKVFWSGNSEGTKCVRSPTRQAWSREGPFIWPTECGRSQDTS